MSEEVTSHDDLAAQDPAGDEPQTRLHLAYAEASVLLLESLMLALVEHGVIPLDALIAAVESAIATKQVQIRDRVHPQIATIAAGVLSQIGNSVAAARGGRTAGSP